MPLKARGSVSARLSVWFSATRRARTLRNRASSTSRPPGSCARQCWLRRDHVQRCAPLRAGLGEHQRAGVEVERRQRRCARLLAPRASSAAGRRSSGAAPASSRRRSPARCVCPRAAATSTRRPCERVQRRLEGAQQERVRDARGLEHLAAHALLERLDVDGDVGKLGHRRRVRGSARPVRRAARAVFPGPPRHWHRPCGSSPSGPRTALRAWDRRTGTARPVAPA